MVEGDRDSRTSFDVFNTSLVRTVTRPDDVYCVLAETLLRRRGVDADTAAIFELARLRVEAEHKARSDLGREDVRLEDVYRHVHPEAWGISPQEMMAEELRLEADWVRPIARTRAEVEAVRRAGGPVVFISDTTLPCDHIRGMLERERMAAPGDRIYTSGDLGLTKASGRLFEFAIGREGVPAGQWVHHGDDARRDDAVPKGLGIRTVFFPDAEPNRYEQLILQEGTGQPWVRSRIAGVSRAVRLMADVTDERFPALSAIAANVAAPLLTCFVAWVLHEARQAGKKRLYFVSRDGEILLEIARVLERHMEVPELRYLYGSRLAWMLPSITRIDRESLAWLLLGAPSPRSALRKLDLKPSEVRHALDAEGLDRRVMEKRLDRATENRFWKVLEHPEVSNLVLERAASARQIALAYFRQEGLTDSSGWALVDLGWALQSQLGLKRMLETVGHDQQVSGYYLATVRERMRMEATGRFRALFIEEESERIKALWTRAMIIEEAFFQASHGMVLGYQWKGERSIPIFHNRDLDPNRDAYVRYFRRVVVAYADEAAEAGLLQDHLDDLRTCALSVAHTFLTQPSRAEAQTVAWITAVDYFHDRDRIRRMVVRLGIRDVIRRLIVRNLSRFETVRRLREAPRRYVWQEGSLALSEPSIRVSYAFASRFHLKSALMIVARRLFRRQPEQPLRKDLSHGKQG